MVRLVLWVGLLLRLRLLASLLLLLVLLLPLSFHHHHYHRYFPAACPRLSRFLRDSAARRRRGRRRCGRCRCRCRGRRSRRRRRLLLWRFYQRFRQDVGPDVDASVLSLKSQRRSLSGDPFVIRCHCLPLRSGYLFEITNSTFAALFAETVTDFSQVFGGVKTGRCTLCSVSTS